MDRSPPPPPLAFTRPLVHVLSTPDLNRVLSSSNFASLSAVLEPFASSSATVRRSPALNNVQVRTPPNHEPRTVRHFSIEFRDRPLAPATRVALERGAAAASSAMERQDSSLAGSVSQSERDVLFLDQLSTRIISNHSTSTSRPPEIRLDPVTLHRTKRRYDLEGNPLPERPAREEEWESKTLDDLAPWYASFRQDIFARREMVEYETWGWPVGCVLALSTAHPDPLNALSILWDLTSPSQLYAASSTSSNPRQQEYANPEVLRYILIVHDARQGGSEQVEKLHETVKKTYGVHTKVLTLWDHYKPLELPSSTGQDSAAAAGAGEASLEHELEKLWPEDLEEEATKRKAITSEASSAALTGLGYLGAVEQDHEQARPLARRGRPGHDLSLVDLQSLSVFTRELVTQSIVPYLERQITVANEQFNNNKKSLGGRLFSVGRKYFGGGASSSTSSTGEASASGGGTGYNPSKGYYPYSSLEAQSRRLADLSFMCEDYALAMNVYAQVAKDYKNDRAWKHYSSALRMQGFCQLLLLAANPSSSSSSSTSPSSCLESSILSPSASIDFDLLRSTMLYHDLYSRIPSASSSRASCAALMRLVDLSIERARQAGSGGDEDELWTALVCEQSALSQLGITNVGHGASTPPTTSARQRMRRERKFVLEMCVAGTRYEKSGLKPLSRRCLSQAVSLYTTPSIPSTSSSTSPPRATTFEAIKGHLHHSLARQAYNASQPLESIHHFLQLLPATSISTSTGGGGGVDWLDDFALAWESSRGAGADQVFELPTRLFDQDKVRVTKNVSIGRGGAPDRDRSRGVAGDGERDDEEWRELDRVAKGGSATTSGRSKGKEKAKDVGSTQDTFVVGETFYLELPVRNPLESEFLSIGGLTAHCSSSSPASAPDSAPESLEVDPSLDGDIVELAPLESRIIHIPVRGRTVGVYEFTSLSYHFHNLLPVSEALSKPTSVRIGEPVPLLTISIEETSAPSVFGLMHGQSRVVTFRFKNAGQIGMKRLRGVTRNPEFATFVRDDNNGGERDARDGKEANIVKMANELGWNKSTSSSSGGRLLAEELIPGGETRIRVLLRGDRVGDQLVKFLFTYESSSSEVFDQRFGVQLQVSPSVELRYATRPNDDTTSRDVSPFLLDIEAYNSGVPTSDLRISGISFVSPLWRLSTTQTNLLPTMDTIPWQGASNVTLALDQARGEAVLEQCDKSIEWTVGQVEKLFQGDKFRNDDNAVGDDKDRPGDVDLTLSSSSQGDDPAVVEFDAVIASHSQNRSKSLAAAFPTVPRPALGRIFPLFSPTSGLVLVRFTCSALDRATDSDATTIGGTDAAETVIVHALPLAAVGAPSEPKSRLLDDVLDAAELKAGGLYEESQRERSKLIESLRANASEFGRGGGGRGGDRASGPVTVFVKVDPGVRAHDFDQRGPCRVPVKFYLRNLSPLTRCDYTLALGTTSSSALVYTGRLTRRGQVDPLELVEIEASAFVTREGAYDVGGWSLEVSAVVSEGPSADGRRGARVAWKTEGEPLEVRVGPARRERGGDV
ncbi:hypothetical protein JCM11491_005627 [Sporobolomyces phaffii]